MFSQLKRRVPKQKRATSRLELYSAVAGLAFCLTLIILAPTDAARMQTLAGLFLLAGAVMAYVIFRQWQQARKVWRLEQAKQADAQRRAALRVVRRARDTENRTERGEKRTAKKRALEETRARRLQESEAKRQAKEAETVRRATQEAQIKNEIERLRSLQEEDYFAEIETLLGGRGFQSQDASTMQAEETSGRFLARKSDTVEGQSFEVVRVLRPTLVADTGEVHALEAWRRDAGASRAWLVSLAGFTSEAAVAVSGLPLLLIDSAIIASWSL